MASRREILAEDWGTPLKISTPDMAREKPPETDQGEEWVKLKVGGLQYEALRSSLNKWPGTLLSELNPHSPYFNQEEKLYKFDRNPYIFQNILDFYRTGHLHFPSNICGPSILDELNFWRIDQFDIAECCWEHVYEYEEKENSLHTLGTYFNLTEKFDKHWQKVEQKSMNEKAFHWRKSLWTFLEEPYASLASKFKAVLYMTLIIASILCLAFETHAFFRIPAKNITIASENITNPKVLLWDTTLAHPAIYGLEVVFTSFFTAELLLRFFTCPCKLLFMKSFFNFLDFLIVITQWVTTAIAFHSDFLEDDALKLTYQTFAVFRICRVLLIFKLSRSYTGLRVLLLALKASLKELALLVIFTSIGMITFATLIYYAEFNEAQQFKNIPEAFWWAIVTMTTVGYGDTYPKTGWGFLIGTLCALSGMLVTGLPIPIIANNFTLYYSVAESKMKLDERKRQRMENESDQTIQNNKI